MACTAAQHHHGSFRQARAYAMPMARVCMHACKGRYLVDVGASVNRLCNLGRRPKSIGSFGATPHINQRPYQSTPIATPSKANHQKGFLPKRVKANYVAIWLQISSMNQHCRFRPNEMGWFMVQSHCSAIAVEPRPSIVHPGAGNRKKGNTTALRLPCFYPGHPCRSINYDHVPSIAPALASGLNHATHAAGPCSFCSRRR